jgi:uncharacterized protein YndB with AHSA1/START domain
MRWTTEFEVRCKASPAQVFKLWSDVTNWRRWDSEVEHSQLDGPFVVGSRGTLKPKGGPSTSFVLTAVERDVKFADRSFLPLATLDFTHTLRVEQGETVILRQVEMRGLLTFLFRRIIGSTIEKGLPGAVKWLARLAELESE